MKISKLLVSGLLSLSLFGQACLPAFAQVENNNFEEIEEINDENTVEDEIIDPEEEEIPVETDEEIEDEIVEEEIEDEIVEEDEANTTEAQTGSCGNSATYSLKDGVLTISGTGAISNYSSFSSAPWYGKVTTLYIEDGITTVGTYCFYDIENVHLPSTLTLIKNNGFIDCKNIYVNSVQALFNTTCENGNAARYNVAPSAVDQKPTLYINGEYESTIEIPEGTTTIPAFAFAYYDNVYRVSLPDSLTTIGSYAFSKSGIGRISIPNSVTQIGSSAFFYCYGLDSISLSNNLNSISYSLFRDCTSLEFVSVPSGVTEIGGLAFSECPNLKYLEIPDTVTTIEKTSGYIPTNGSGNLDTIFYHGSAAQWENIKDGFGTYKTLYTDIIARFSNSRYDYVFYGIKDSVLTICGEGSMKELENEAYPWASSSSQIKEVRFVGEVNSVAPMAFSNLTALERAYLGDYIETLGEKAFYNCKKLHTVVLPETITDYGKSIFSNCTSLSNIILPTTIPGISESMFAQCTALKSITIPEGATSIGKEAFNGCTSLTTVNLPLTMASIGNDAFKNCSSINTVKYPGNINNWSSMQKGSGNDAITKNSNHYSWINSPAHLVGYKARVGSTIVVDFYVETNSPTNTQVTFTLPNGSTTSKSTYDKSITQNGKTYYLYSCEIPAKDMTGTITVDIYQGQSNHQGRYTFTFNEYLEYIIQNADSMYEFSSYYRNVAKALLTYGNYTQVYFNYKTNCLPKAYSELIDPNFSSYQYYLKDNDSNLDFAGARLVLKSNVQLKLYFKGTGNIYVDGVKQIGNIEDDCITILLNNTEWRKIYKITTDNGFTLHYGVFSYAYQALRGNNTKLKNLIKAMYTLKMAVGVG